MKDKINTATELMEEVKTARTALRCAVRFLSMVNNDVMGSSIKSQEDEDSVVLDEIYYDVMKMEQDFSTLRHASQKLVRNCGNIHERLGDRKSIEEVRGSSARFRTRELAADEIFNSKWSQQTPTRALKLAKMLEELEGVEE